MLKERNVIEVLHRYGENKKVGFAYAFSFLYVIDPLDDYIFKAQEELIKKRPSLYKRNLKKMINEAYNNIHSLADRIKIYINEDWDIVLQNLDDYKERYKREIQVLYFTMLQQSGYRWFGGDTDLAQICVKLDMCHVVLAYWQKMTNQLIAGLPYPINKITNDYEIMIERCRRNLHDFVVDPQALPKKDVRQLTEKAEKEFQSAFVAFVHSVTQVFSDMIQDGENRTN